ncbi:MAG: UDP-3-O-(3-hydroxymyristoyl)glucosamine N-acyltransferase [Chthoniobacteraceae bacterium]
MTITIQELAALVGGQFALAADGTKTVCGGAAIAEAGEGDVTFFGNSKYLPALKTCRATAALVPMDFSEEIPPVAIRVENPSLAFSKLIEKFAPAPVTFPSGVHPSAVIGRDVTIGEGASVQPFTVIEDGASVGARSVIGAHGYIGHGAKVGAGCLLHPRVTVGARCLVGNRVILHSGVVLGSDGFGFEFSDGKHVKIPQVGIVQLDDDVEIGANTTLDRARFGRTWIGEGTKIDNLVQIAHNVVIGKHSLVIALTGIAGSVKIGNYVTIAGQVGIVGHIEIGDQVIVAAKSGISKNIPAKEVVWGSPSLPMREAKEQLALIRRLPKLFERVKKLESGEQDAGADSKFFPSES